MTGFESVESWIGDADARDPGLAADPDDDVVQLYTSGTTGLPKGVQLTSRNYMTVFDLVDRFDGLKYQAGETVLGLMPFFHVAGVNIALIALASGARTAVVQGFRARRRARPHQDGAGQLCLRRARDPSDADAVARRWRTPISPA